MASIAFMGLVPGRDARAQTVINNTPPQAAPAPAPAPQPAPTIVEQPAPQPTVIQQAPQPAPVVVNNSGGGTVNEGHLVYAPRMGLVVSGATMFGVTYIATILGGAIASDVCQADATLGCRTTSWPLYFPIIGPFAQMGYINGTGANTGRALLAIDGGLQAAGVAMFVIGMATGWRHVPPATTVSKRIDIVPYGGNAGTGLLAVGRF